MYYILYRIVCLILLFLFDFFPTVLHLTVTRTGTYLQECVLEDEREELDDWELRAALEPPKVVPHERPQEVCQLVHEPGI